MEDSQTIQNHIHQYFSELYAEPSREAVQPGQFQCDQVIPDNDATNEACMDPITMAEMWIAIKSRASKESPGPDGIPKESFARAFVVIHRKQIFSLMRPCSLFPHRSLLRRGSHRLIVKKKGSGNTVGSYRPISLLNFDYKLFSRILKARLENVMREHNILSTAQKSSNGHNNIFQATLALKDRIAQLRAVNKPSNSCAFRFRSRV